VIIIDLSLRLQHPRLLVVFSLISLAFLTYTVLESGRALDVAIVELRHCAICWIQ